VLGYVVQLTYAISQSDFSTVVTWPWNKQHGCTLIIVCGNTTTR